MRKYADLFMNYVIEHQDEIRYCGEKYDYYTNAYVFKLRSPKKLFGIIPINYRFIIYDNINNDEDIIDIIDVDVFYHGGVRFDLDIEEHKNFVKFLGEKFRTIYNKWCKEDEEKEFRRLIE